jgi:hypothetical protein
MQRTRVKDFFNKKLMVKNLDDNDQQLALKKHSQFKAMELAIF